MVARAAILKINFQHLFPNLWLIWAEIYTVATGWFLDQTKLKLGHWKSKMATTAIIVRICFGHLANTVAKGWFLDQNRLKLCGLEIQDGRHSYHRETLFWTSCKPQGELHCSAVITRSSGAMNTDRVIRGPRYTEHDNHTHLHHCSFLQLLWDITHCMYVILYVPFLFIYFLFFFLL